MKGSKKVWLTGSALAAIAALVAVLAIPVGASAKTTRQAAVVHCAASHDTVVSADMFANNDWTGGAESSKCAVTVHGKFTPGAIVKPVIVLSKVTVDANGGISGSFGNKTFQGTIQGQMAMPTKTKPGSYRIKIHVCIDIDPPSIIITIKF